MHRNYILVDTGAWYALFDKNDGEHERASQFFAINHAPFLITDYIVDETLTLLTMRLGHRKAVEIGKQFWNHTLARLIDITSDDKNAAWKIFQRYTV